MTGISYRFINHTKKEICEGDQVSVSIGPFGSPIAEVRYITPMGRWGLIHPTFEDKWIVSPPPSGVELNPNYFVMYKPLTQRFVNGSSCRVVGNIYEHPNTVL